MIRFVPTGSEKRHRIRIERSEEDAMDVTLVSSQRRVIESPVSEVVVSAVSVPIDGWEVCGYLHPVSLSFEISEFRWSSGAGVGEHRDRGSDQ